MYLVSGHSNHFFYKDKYYRLHNSSWEASVHFDGPWKSVNEKKLPPGLKQHKNKGKKKK